MKTTFEIGPVQQSATSTPLPCREGVWTKELRYFWGFIIINDIVPDKILRLREKKKN